MSNESTRVAAVAVAANACIAEHNAIMGEMFELCRDYKSYAPKLVEQLLCELSLMQQANQRYLNVAKQQGFEV